MLADAFGEVARARPGLRLLVVGGGDVEEARALLPPSVVHQVTFLGGASDADKASALRTADVCVAPNTAGESFGIVLAEAMAAGATVLASDIPAFARLLEEGRYGVLFRNGDADDLAAHLAELLDDPARRGVLDKAARLAVRRYDWATVTTRIVRVYETVVAGSG